jgi:glycosyltransferase involved in cell wall biosynthesis
VIIPVYNRRDEVRTAVRSALDQRGVELEVIVVDDGSNDGTDAIVREVDDARLRVITTAHGGVAHARNVGVDAARGQWIAPLDSDDAFTPGALTELLALIASDVDAVFGSVVLVGSNGSTERKAPSRLGAEYHDTTALFLAGAMLIRTAAWRELTGQRTGLAFGENGEFGMRLAARTHRLGRRFAVTPVVTAQVTRREVVRHNDATRAAAAQQVIRDNIELLSLSRSALASHWAIAAVHLARAGRSRDAVRAQLKAVRSDPGDLRQTARLAVLAVPHLRRRLYPPRVVGEPGT